MSNSEHSPAKNVPQTFEKIYQLSLTQGFRPEELDFTDNPNILLEIIEFNEAIGIKSPIQAGILVNQDHSCWLTNLGRNGSTEVYRPENGRYRRLAYNQVAYLRHGDAVGFYGTFFRLLFGYSKLQFKPISEHEYEQLRVK